MYRFLVVLTLVVGLSSANAAGPVIKKTIINGLDVYLINTHTGNGAALTVNIQEGSLHDEPVHHAGRSHLWEHVFHSGSQRFPGRGTFDRLMGPAGGAYNAYTASNRVFFHGYLHSSAFAEAAAVLGAAVSAPEWNPESFEAEKKNVKNEALEYQGTDSRALSAAMMLHLLPKGHPFAMYPLGTQAQLDAMTMDDLKDLYYSNYIAGSLQVIVAGNFDTLPDGTTPLKEAEVLAQVAANFFPANTKNDPHGYKKKTPALKTKIFPSILGGAKYLEMGTSSGARVLKLIFETKSGPSKFDFESYETLLDILNLSLPGSFKILLLERGWITDCSFMPEVLNNLKSTEAIFQLTEEGSLHRREIPEFLFSYLHDLLKNGISPKLLEYLRTRNVTSYTRATMGADQAAEYLARGLDLGLTPSNVFDFEGRFARVTENSVQEAIGATFSVDGMLSGYLGPDVQSDVQDALFLRPIKVFSSWGELGARYVKSFEHGGLTDPGMDVDLADFDLNLSKAPVQGPTREARAIDLRRPGLGVVLEENHTYPTAGIILTLQLAPPSTQGAVVPFILTRAFQKNYRQEIDYFGTLGIALSMNAGPSSIRIAVDGNSAGALQVLRWVVRNLISYLPHESEFRYQTVKMKQIMQGEFDSFTAKQSNLAADGLFSRYELQDLETIDALARISYGDFAATTRRLWSSTDLLTSFVGDITEGQARLAISDIEKELPRRLSKSQRDRVASGNLKVTKSMTVWKKLFGSKDENAVAITRVIQGPQPFTREHAALLVLEVALGEAIFDLNRTEKSLGYIHRSDIRVTPTGVQIWFFGQTEGHENLIETRRGWDEVLERAFSGTLTSDGYAATRTGILRTQSLIPSTQTLVAGRNMSSYRLSGGEPLATDRFLKMVMSVTPEEIQAVAIKYLKNSQHVDVIAAKKVPDFEPCIDLYGVTPRVAKALVQGK